jgi:3'(2'), 5'-bisphosphate nucleotidase
MKDSGAIQYKQLKEIAGKAGDAIMDIYAQKDFSGITDFKADDSPLTLADKKSHEIINGLLIKYFPEIPVLSEEGKDISYDERKDWQQFWLVDPLDGTKEFINRNGEFTVNIALIEKGHPVLGIIYVPATGIYYFGRKSEGAFKEENGEQIPLNTNKKTENMKAVGSRSHSAPEEKDFLEKLNISEVISKGSSLKFCMVAEGKADVYFRHNPTMEWDTAAGQAIVEAAGGVVLNPAKNNFTYNKQSLRNGSFYCLSHNKVAEFF